MGSPAAHGWLGIPYILAALGANSQLFLARQPATPLRVLALIALGVALRSRGLKMGADLRRAIVEALDFGALLNDRFDGDVHDAAALRAKISWFANSGYRKVARYYAKRLRHLERSRPAICEGLAAVKCYRENVNHVSLTFLWALARDVNFADAELEIRQETDLRLLYQMVMLSQLIDDLIDVRQDLCRCLPSFATGPDVTLASLCTLVSVYSESNPIRADRHFCLRVALKFMGTSARLVIMVRAGMHVTSSRSLI